MLISPAGDIVGHIMKTGSSLDYKRKVQLLDRIIEAKNKFGDDQLKKVVQSNKFSIGKMIKNIQAKLKKDKSTSDLNQKQSKNESGDNHIENSCQTFKDGDDQKASKKG